MATDLSSIGITGHRHIPPYANLHVVRAIKEFLEQHPRLTVAVSCLAAGADQIFAREALQLGLKLIAIIPSDGFEATLGDARSDFRKLVLQADERIYLDYPRPSNEAYLAAGRQVVDRSDQMLAVWDGQPAAGPGGTADVVAYARTCHVPVEIIWPDHGPASCHFGASRSPGGSR